MLDLETRADVDALVAAPWPIHAAVGQALFAVLAQVYVVGAGYWPQTMNTLAIVLMSLPPAVAVSSAVCLTGPAARRRE